MTSTYRTWIALLTATTAALHTAPVDERLILAQEALRLAWTTARSVRTTGCVQSGLHWIRLAETTVALADVLDRSTGQHSTRLGSGPAPDSWLCDAAGLRIAVQRLLDAVRSPASNGGT